MIRPPTEITAYMDTVSVLKNGHIQLGFKDDDDNRVWIYISVETARELGETLRLV
jgi:hypothetical protein